MPKQIEVKDKCETLQLWQERQESLERQKIELNLIREKRRGKDDEGWG